MRWFQQTVKYTTTICNKCYLLQSSKLLQACTLVMHLFYKPQRKWGEDKVEFYLHLLRNIMKCPVGQLCNPAQVPPAFLRSFCCSCTAPVKASVPLQTDLSSPSSGESHEQSQSFALQPHPISGLWVMPIFIWAKGRVGGGGNLSVYFEILFGREFLDLSLQSLPVHSAFCCCCTLFFSPSGVTCSHARMCMIPQV